MRAGQDHPNHARSRLRRSVELAQAFASLGSSVTLVEAGERLIAGEEGHASEQVTDALRRAGPDIADQLHAATTAVVAQVPLDDLWHELQPLEHPSRARNLGSRKCSGGRRPTKLRRVNRGGSPYVTPLSLPSMQRLNQGRIT